MPSITYAILFHRRNPSCSDLETQGFTALPAAWEAYRLFAESDSAEIYTCIELVAHNWEEGTEAQISCITFAEPYSF